VQHHDAYRWLCGSVEVGYHTLRNFRSSNGERLSDLITQVLGLLMQKSGAERRDRHAPRPDESKAVATWACPDGHRRGQGDLHFTLTYNFLRVIALGV
jgi:hypothetical protein